MKTLYRSLEVVGFVILCIALPKIVRHTSRKRDELSPAKGQIQEASFGYSSRSVPVQFTVNRGQFNRKICYYTKSAGHAVLFGANAVTFRKSVENTADKEEVKTSEFTLHFLGANEKVEIQGIEKTSSRSNYYLGNNSRNWKENVPGYQAINYHNLYDGIDLYYGESHNRLKSTFFLEAGRSPDAIRLRYTGTGPLRITRNSSLEVRTPQGRIIDSPPLVYQTDKNNRRIYRKASYKLFDKTTYGFEIENIDPKLPLVIDPQLGYSGSFGGSNGDLVYDLAEDKDGMLYFTGFTYSSDFPTVNAFQDSLNGSTDVFIVKLDPATNEILYSTYLGGSGTIESAYGITVDDSGNAYVTGVTTSNDFPMVNARQDTFGGGYNDAFVVKLNSQGQVLFSTYFGGTNYDGGYGICLDNESNIWIAGYSSDVPAKNPLQSAGGVQDGFIAEFSNDGSNLLFATPYGGSDYDQFKDIVCDDSDNIYLSGDSYSTDFPLHNPTQDTIGGESDAVVVKLRSGDKSVLFSSYFGGSSYDFGNKLTVDKQGDIFITGNTESTDLPLQNQVQDTLGGGNDAYVSGWYLNPGTGIYSNDFSTYLGGTGDEYANCINVMDDNGNDSLLKVLVGGGTYSTDFPMGDTLKAQRQQPPSDPVKTLAGRETNPKYLQKTTAVNALISPDLSGFLLRITHIRYPGQGADIDFSSILDSLSSVDAMKTVGETSVIAGRTKTGNYRVYWGQVSYIIPPTLSVKKTVDKDTVEYGDTLTFCITVENTGNEPAENVKITDLIDWDCFILLNVDYDNYTLKNDSVANAVLLTANIGELGTDLLNKEDNFCFTVIAGHKGDCYNTATAQGDNTPRYSDEAHVYVGQPTAIFSKSTGEFDSFHLGDTVTYTLTMKNTGNVTITNAYLVDEYYETDQYFIKASGAQYVSKQDDQMSPNLTDEHCEIGNLLPGESKSVKLTFRSIKFLDDNGIEFIPDFAEGGYLAYNLANKSIQKNIYQLKSHAIVSNLYFENSSVANKKKSARTKQQIESLSLNKLQIYIDSLDLGKLSGIDSGMVVNNFDLRAVSPYIHFVNNDDTDILNPVYAHQFDFYTGNLDDSTFNLPMNYQLLIPDYTNKPMVILKRNWRQTAQDQSKVDFYIAHAVDNGQTYNIDLAGMNTDIATGLQFGQTSDYVSVAPGTYTLEIRNSNDELVASSDLDLSNDAGRSLTLILAPTDSTGSNGMGIKIFGASSVDSIWTLEGESSITSIDQATAGQKVYLSYRYTNPISIDFTLPEAGLATIKVYDLNGREVATLTHKFYNPGSYSVPFNTTGLPAGLYIYRLVTNGAEISIKIMIRPGL